MLNDAILRAAIRSRLIAPFGPGESSARLLLIALGYGFLPAVDLLEKWLRAYQARIA